MQAGIFSAVRIGEVTLVSGAADAQVRIEEDWIAGVMTKCLKVSKLDDFYPKEMPPAMSTN